MKNNNQKRPPMKKGVLPRILKMLFKSYIVRIGIHREAIRRLGVYAHLNNL